MSDHSHLRDYLTPEEYAELRTLKRRLSLLEAAMSPHPMSQRELAEPQGCSQQSISLTELRAKQKLRRALAGKALR